MLTSRPGRRSGWTEAWACVIAAMLKAGKTVYFASALQASADDMKERLVRLGVSEEEMKLITFKVLGEEPNG